MKRNNFWSWWRWLLVISLVIFGLVFGQIIRQARNYYLTFLRAADINNQEFSQLVQTIFQTDQPRLKEERDWLFLVLGVDSLDYRPGDRIMTDTIILAHLNLDRAQLNILSIPRDVYLPDVKMKVNALYDQALTAGVVNPEKAVADYLGNLIEVPIDYSFVLSLEQVSDLVDMLGGVEVEVERGFTDYLYPRSDVDVTVETDPAILYETIAFFSGKQLMSGERVLQYMRSRHAAGEEGSDLARAVRQQRAIDAFANQAIKQILDARTMVNFPLLGSLYAYYQQNFEKYLPLHFGLAMTIDLINQRQTPQISQAVISVYPIQADGVLEEATPLEMQRDYGGAWVWKVRDWTQLINEMRTDLGYEEILSIN